MEHNIILGVKTVFAAVGGFCGMFWGEMDGVMLALLAFIVIDYITGLIVAIANKTLNSSVGFKGLAKKVFVIRHFDVTGKDCPAPMVENQTLWTDFKNKLEVIEMKVYKYVPEMPEWARDTFTRLYKAGVVKADITGAVAVQESSLQPMVYLDRLTEGQIEKLPELIRILPELEKMIDK